MNIPQTKSFIIDGSERSIQDTLSNLIFISKIQEGHIMNVFNHTLSESSWITSAVRTVFTRDESREKTLEFFRRTFHDAFGILDECMKNRNTSPGFYDPMIIRLVQSIENSKKGLANHSKTYITDHMHVSRVDALLASVNVNLGCAKSRVKEEFNLDALLDR